LNKVSILEIPCPECGGKVEQWEFDSDCRGNSPSSGIQCTQCKKEFSNKEELNKSTNSPASSDEHSSNAEEAALRSKLERAITLVDCRVRVYVNLGHGEQTFPAAVLDTVDEAGAYKTLLIDSLMRMLTSKDVVFAPKSKGQKADCIRMMCPNPATLEAVCVHVPLVSRVRCCREKSCQDLAATNARI
jgi:hypothetical protein